MRFLKTFEVYYGPGKTTRTTDLSEKEFNILYEKECSNHKLNKDIALLRGVKNKERKSFTKYKFIDPTKYSRRSIEDENLHSILIDTMPRWKDFPPYSKSIIGTNQFNSASPYGEVYDIIPFNNSKIGIVPFYNIWKGFGGFDKYSRIKNTQAFLETFYDFDNPNVSWENIKRAAKGLDFGELHLEYLDERVIIFLGMMAKWDNDSNVSGKVEDRELQQYLYESWDISDAKHYLKRITSEKVIEFIEFMFDPNILGFESLFYDKNFSYNFKKILKSKNIPIDSRKGGYEDGLQIWTSGPVLLRHVNSNKKVYI